MVSPKRIPPTPFSAAYISAASHLSPLAAQLSPLKHQEYADLHRHSPPSSPHIRFAEEVCGAVEDGREEAQAVPHPPQPTQPAQDVQGWGEGAVPLPAQLAPLHGQGRVRQAGDQETLQVQTEEKGRSHEEQASQA